MLFELVKNPGRAVQERFQDADLERPPIGVVVVDGVEDVTSKMKEVGFPGQQKPESTAKNLVIFGWQDQEMPSVMTGSALTAYLIVDPMRAFLEAMYK